jgi:hypothetical protein
MSATDAMPAPQSSAGGGEPSPAAEGAEAASVTALPGSADGGPAAVSRRSSNFLLYLVLMGGAAILIGAFLPRIQAIKLGGAEVDFAPTIPQAADLRLLASIGGKPGSPARKRTAAREAHALSTRVAHVRVSGRELARPVLGRRRLQVGRRPAPAEDLGMSFLGPQHFIEVEAGGRPEETRQALAEA